MQSVEAPGDSRPSSQNFRRDVVDIMELMEIKSIKSYRKLYDPKIVQKLERIKAVGDTESQPSVLRLLRLRNRRRQKVKV